MLESFMQAKIVKELAQIGIARFALKGQWTDVVKKYTEFTWPSYQQDVNPNKLLRLGQARHSSTNIFHIFYLTLLLYSTIDSALVPYYLGLFCYYGLIFLPEAETYVDHLFTFFQYKLTLI